MPTSHRSVCAPRCAPFDQRHADPSLREGIDGLGAFLAGDKLAWAPGSIDNILAGGEPNETVVELRRTTHKPVSHVPSEALSRASTEELLLELRRRISAPRSRRHEDPWCA